MSPKLYVVIKREFLARVRTKGFLIFTFLIPVIGAAVLFAEFKIIQASNHVGGRIAVVDLSQRVYPELAAVAAAQQNDAQAARLQFHPVEATPATLDAVVAGLRRDVLNHADDGYLVLPADVLDSRKADYDARNPAAVSVNSTLSDDLSRAITRARMLGAGIPANQIDGMVGDMHMQFLKVTANGSTKDNGQTAIVAIVLVMVLYIALLLYGVTVMRSVTEEKTSRISEVLLSAVDPYRLMLGKIFGVVATALTQFAVWAVCLALASGYALAMAEAGGANLAQYVPHIGAGLLVSWVVFFMLGFLLYASIYAAIGAMVSSDQEAQQTQMPLTMFLVAAIYLAFLVMAQPTSTLSVVLSLIPFFAPVLMVVRIAVSSPPLWQVVVAMVLCFATFMAFTRVTAKIYRVGILMTGKRPNLPELLRWLKYA